MKIEAIHPRPLVASTVFFLMLAVSGCALPLPDKPVRPEPYDLGPALARTDAPAATQLAPVAMSTVESSAAIDGTVVIYRLMYTASGQQPRPYAQARWTMSPPQLVTQRLREALSAVRPVVEPGAGLAAIELRADLDEFSQVFASPTASEGVVQLRVTATAPGARTGRLLGQRTVTVRWPAPTPDAAGGVRALRAATDETVRQVVAWVGALQVPK